MRDSRWRVTRLARIVAFVVTIMVGIVGGYVLTVGEEIEERFKTSRRDTTGTSRHRR